MDRDARLSMTVGELAYAMKIGLETAKAAAQVASSRTRLSSQALESALARLETRMGFYRKSWDLHELDGRRGAWVESLRKLYSIPVAFPASLPPSQGNQIRDLVLRETPQRVLEIGCFIGISSHWIASALEELDSGRLTSVDTFWPKYPNRFHFSYLADPYDCAVTAAQNSGLGDRIAFHCIDSAAYARSLNAQETFDFIFIDGDHTFAGVTRDFVALFPHLRKGGVILLHDTNPESCGWQGPRRLIDQVLSTSPQVAVEEIDTKPNYGMAVIRKLSDGALLLTAAQNWTVNAHLATRAIQNRLLQTSPAKALLRSVIKPTVARLRYA